jgi:hypothetical protein
MIIKGTGINLWLEVVYDYVHDVEFNFHTYHIITITVVKRA